MVMLYLPAWCLWQPVDLGISTKKKQQVRVKRNGPLTLIWSDHFCGTG